MIEPEISCCNCKRFNRKTSMCLAKKQKVKTPKLTTCTDDRDLKVIK